MAARAMRASFAVPALMVAGLGVSGLAIGFGDRQTMTPPPDAVLESFVRQLAEGRHDMAVKYLSVSLLTTTDAETLKTWFEPRRGQLGDLSGVDAEIDRMDRVRASARAIVDAEHASLVLKAPLVWEAGGWRVAALPEDVQLMPHPGAH
jgi:hypothetical protein